MARASQKSGALDEDFLSSDDKGYRRSSGSSFQPQSSSNSGGSGARGVGIDHHSKAPESNTPPPPPPKTVGKPAFFNELGKPVKDLFTKGFAPSHTLMVSCLAPGNTMLSTTATMADGLVMGLVIGSFKRAGVTTEITTGTTNQISVATIYEDLVPGLKVNLTTTVPDAVNYGKGQVQYQHDYAAVSSTVSGFKAKPAVEFSTNVGSDKLSLGSSFVYNTDTRAVTSLTAGLGYTTPERSALLLFDPQSEKSVDAYGMQALSPTTTLGLHLNHKLEKNVTKATLAGSYRLDPRSTVKGRIDNYGILGALLQYEPNPLASVGMYAEIDTKALTTAKPKIGLSLSLVGAI